MQDALLVGKPHQPARPTASTTYMLLLFILTTAITTSYFMYKCQKILMGYTGCIAHCHANQGPFNSTLKKAHAHLSKKPRIASSRNSFTTTYKTATGLFMIYIQAFSNQPCLQMAT